LTRSPKDQLCLTFHNVWKDAYHISCTRSDSDHWMFFEPGQWSLLRRCV
jgi:hypothetical protein